MNNNNDINRRKRRRPLPVIAIDRIRAVARPDQIFGNQELPAGLHVSSDDVMPFDLDEQDPILQECMEQQQEAAAQQALMRTGASAPVSFQANQAGNDEDTALVNVSEQTDIPSVGASMPGDTEIHFQFENDVMGRLGEEIAAAEEEAEIMAMLDRDIGTAEAAEAQKQALLTHSSQASPQSTGHDSLLPVKPSPGDVGAPSSACKFSDEAAGIVTVTERITKSMKGQVEPFFTPQEFHESLVSRFVVEQEKASLPTPFCFTAELTTVQDDPSCWLLTIVGHPPATVAFQVKLKSWLKIKRRIATYEFLTLQGRLLQVVLDASGIFGAVLTEVVSVVDNNAIPAGLLVSIQSAKGQLGKTIGPNATALGAAIVHVDGAACLSVNEFKARKVRKTGGMLTVVLYVHPDADLTGAQSPMVVALSHQSAELCGPNDGTDDAQKQIQMVTATKLLPKYLRNGSKPFITQESFQKTLVSPFLALERHKSTTRRLRGFSAELRSVDHDPGSWRLTVDGHSANVEYFQRELVKWFKTKLKIHNLMLLQSEGILLSIRLTCSESVGANLTEVHEYGRSEIEGLLISIVTPAGQLAKAVGPNALMCGAVVAYVNGNKCTSIKQFMELRDNGSDQAFTLGLRVHPDADLSGVPKSTAIHARTAPRRQVPLLNSSALDKSSRETPKTPTTYHYFKRRYTEVAKLEFKDAKIRVRFALGQMWQQHKKRFGDACSDDCECLFDLSSLAADVVGDYIKREATNPKSKWKNDCNLKEGDWPVGFIGHFAKKFLPKLREEYSGEQPSDLQARLLIMWEAHRKNRNFGLECNTKCECSEDWEPVFQAALGKRSRGDDAAKSIKRKRGSVSMKEASPKPTGTRSSGREPRGDDTDKSPIADRRMLSLDSVPLKRKKLGGASQTLISSQVALGSSLQKESRNNTESLLRSKPVSLALSSKTAIAVSSAASASAKIRNPTAASPSVSTKVLQVAPLHASVRVASAPLPPAGSNTIVRQQLPLPSTGRSTGGMREYSVIFDPREPLGFFCVTDKHRCKVHSVCPRGQASIDLRIQKCTTVCSAQVGEMRYPVKGYQELCNYYGRASKEGLELRLWLINDLVSVSVLRDSSAGAVVNTDWNGTGHWRGNVSVGWAGGAASASPKIRNPTAASPPAAPVGVSSRSNVRVRQQLPLPSTGRSTGGMREYSVTFDPSKPLGFFCVTDNKQSGVTRCKVHSVCPRGQVSSDVRIQKCTTVCSAQVGAMRYPVKGYQDLRNYYGRASEEGLDLRLWLINDLVSASASTDYSVMFNENWTSTGHWRGNVSVGWAGGVPGAGVRPKVGGRAVRHVSAIASGIVSEERSNILVDDRSSIDLLQPTADVLPLGNSLTADNRAISLDSRRKRTVRFAEAVNTAAPADSVAVASRPVHPVTELSPLDDEDALGRAVRFESFKDVLRSLSGGVLVEKRQTRYLDELRQSLKDKKALLNKELQSKPPEQHEEIKSKMLDIRFKDLLLKIYKNAAHMASIARSLKEWVRFEIEIVKVEVRMSSNARIEEDGLVNVLSTDVNVSFGGAGSQLLRPLPEKRLSSCVVHDDASLSTCVEYDSGNLYNANHNTSTTPERALTIDLRNELENGSKCRELGQIHIPLSHLHSRCSRGGGWCEIVLNAPPTQLMPSAKVTLRARRSELDSAHVEQKRNPERQRMKNVIKMISRFNEEVAEKGLVDCGNGDPAILPPTATVYGGMTLLHTAVFLEDERLVAALLDLGADPYAKAMQGQSALSLALNMADVSVEKTRTDEESTAQSMDEGRKAQRARVDAILKLLRDSGQPTPTVGRMPSQLSGIPQHDAMQTLSGIRTAGTSGDSLVSGDMIQPEKSLVESNARTEPSAEPTTVPTAEPTVEPDDEALGAQESISEAVAPVDTDCLPSAYNPNWILTVDPSCLRESSVCKFWGQRGSCPHRACNYFHVMSPFEVEFLQMAAKETKGHEDIYSADWTDSPLSQYRALYTHCLSPRRLPLVTAALVKTTEQREVYYAQGSPGRKGKDDTWWYHSEEDAKKALERLLVAVSWGTARSKPSRNRGMQPEHRTCGSSSSSDRSDEGTASRETSALTSLRGTSVDITGHLRSSRKRQTLARSHDEPVGKRRQANRSSSPEPERIDPSIEICRNFRRGLCPRGIRCQYRHAVEASRESRAIPTTRNDSDDGSSDDESDGMQPQPSANWLDDPNIEICRNFRRGSCPRGNRCKHLHVGKATMWLRGVSAAINRIDHPKSAGKRQPPVESLDEPDRKRQATMSLLPDPERLPQLPHANWLGDPNIEICKKFQSRLCLGPGCRYQHVKEPLGTALDEPKGFPFEVQLSIISRAKGDAFAQYRHYRKEGDWVTAGYRNGEKNEIYYAEGAPGRESSQGVWWYKQQSLASLQVQKVMLAANVRGKGSKRQDPIAKPRIRRSSNSTCS